MRPMLEGRSSTGRLGIVYSCNRRFRRYWLCRLPTLEIYCIHPLIIYPDIEACQIYYHTIKGDYDFVQQRKVPK